MKSSATDSTILFGIIRKLFRPLLRMALRQNFSFRVITALLKREYVAIAREELDRQGLPVNSSRISAMTGINRNDIQDVEQNPDALPPLSLNMVARVLGAWEADKRFRDSRGRPRALTCTGQDSEFQRLVESVSGHLSYSTVLAEFERLGVVDRKGELVRYQEAIAMGSENIQRTWDLLARNIDSLCSAVEENLQRGEMDNLHLRTSYDNVMVRDIKKVKERIREEGKKFHARMRALISKYDADFQSDGTPEAAGGRVVVVTFAHTETPGTK